MKNFLAGLIVFSCFILPLVSEARERVSPSNKFGFLGHVEKQSLNYIEYAGAGWMRPHPGPAVWGMIQDKKKAEYDWDYMDETVTKAQKRGINLLITIWPFATWDQKNNSNYCKVAENDEFLLPEGAKKGDIEYLPRRRCNPHSWKKYRTWVKAMVERYDGDGEDDMSGLKYGIKYWEVMNEPDLKPGADVYPSDNPEEDTLDFYQQDSDAYYKLLKKTYTAIKDSDASAKVLIAGAAGGNDDFLGFYEDIFKDHSQVKKYFNIGNVHCISNDYYNNFNVKAYKRLLNKYNINKNIWVTEAEAMMHQTKEENYTQARQSTKKALNAGASKIFYTRFSFAGAEEGKGAGMKYSKRKYKIIFDKFD